MVELIGIPVRPSGVRLLTPLVSQLRQLLLPRCGLGDAGVRAICDGLRSSSCVLERLCVSGNGLTSDACVAIGGVIAFHAVHRTADTWQHSLRGREPEPPAAPVGLRAIDMSWNPSVRTGSTRVPANSDCIQVHMLQG